MKKSLLLTVIFVSIQLAAQAPEMISYQALLRNNTGGIIQNGNVGMRISVLQGSVSGPAVYTETHTTTTNENGLITLNIGSGTTTDSFAAIDWGNGSYYIKTETDPNGGTDYTIEGTSQLLSVPYALYAKSTGGVNTDPNGVSDIQIPSGNVVNSANFILNDADADKIYTYNGNTGVWSEQSTSQFFTTGSIIESEGNVIMNDADADKLYAYSSKLGTWTEQSTSQFFNTASIVASNGNFAMNDADDDKVYVYNGNTGVWSEQSTSQFFNNTSIVASKGSFVLNDSDADKVFAYSSNQGTWTEQSTSQFFNTASIVESNGFFVMNDADADVVYAFSGVTGTWSQQATSQFFSTGSIIISGN
jgi:hypothetical protein